MPQRCRRRALDARQAVGVELDRDAVVKQAAADRARRQLAADQALDRVDQAQPVGSDRDAGREPAGQAGRRRQLGQIV
jgi:hypothetical protein